MSCISCFLFKCFQLFIIYGYPGYKVIQTAQKKDLILFRFLLLWDLFIWFADICELLMILGEVVLEIKDIVFDFLFVLSGFKRLLFLCLVNFKFNALFILFLFAIFLSLYFSIFKSLILFDIFSLSFNSFFSSFFNFIVFSLLINLLLSLSTLKVIDSLSIFIALRFIYMICRYLWIINDIRRGCTRN